MRIDAAVIGVVGGQVQLASDQKGVNGQGKVPMMQALREVKLKGGATITQITRDHAVLLAETLNAWHGYGGCAMADIVNIFNDYAGQVRLRGRVGAAARGCAAATRWSSRDGRAPAHDRHRSDLSDRVHRERLSRDSRRRRSRGPHAKSACTTAISRTRSTRSAWVRTRSRIARARRRSIRACSTPRRNNCGTRCSRPSTSPRTARARPASPPPARCGRACASSIRIRRRRARRRQAKVAPAKRRPRIAQTFHGIYRTKFGSRAAAPRRRDRARDHVESVRIALPSTTSRLGCQINAADIGAEGRGSDRRRAAEHPGTG